MPVHPRQLVAGASRASVAIISRDVNRSWSRPSLPSATSSGLARTAAITWSNCSLPSECRRRTSQDRGW
jgi:hypothetical protein